MRASVAVQLLVCLATAALFTIKNRLRSPNALGLHYLLA
jgi:hypothetical protein